MNHKVVPLDFLRNVGGMLVHGCFDLLHYGHLKFLSWVSDQLHRSQDGSRRHYDSLIVTITADEFFPRHKGPGRPAFPEDVRADWLSYIDIIDWVAIVREPTGVLAIETIRPQVYAKGHEAEGLIPEETAAVERHGGRVIFMPAESRTGQVYSSGRILSGEYLRSRNA